MLSAFVHVLHRQQGMERPAVSGLAAALPSGAPRPALWGTCSGSDEGEREELEESWPSRASNSRMRS
jgi:hypothetical protein